MRKRTERYIIRIIFVAVVAALIYVVYDKIKTHTANVPSEATSTVQTTSASSTPTWVTKTISEKTNNTDIDIKYPEFAGKINLNEFILKKINSTIKDDRDVLKTIPNSEIDLTANYQVIGVKDDVISILLTFSDFTGGGNGNHDIPYTINWDLKFDKVLEPEDLFCNTDYMNILAPIVKDKLIRQLGATGDSIDDIDMGLKPDTKNWQNFGFSDQNLIVTFPPYQVTAGAAGIIHVPVSYDEIPRVICLRR